MKIRIKSDSLRYRLTQPDVARLCSEGKIEEQTAFVGGTLIYAVEIGEADRLSASFTQNKIVLRMSREMISTLKDTDQVGFDDHSGPVNLLVEKDFVCLQRTDEDQLDQYPNPALKC